jgi:AcrR family transcriptional regulator
MTTADPEPVGARPAKPSRARDAGASRQALLGAAQELFGQGGFERTTVREIGERAGVDAALIARYFGSKADLYIAAVAAERMGDEPTSEYEGLEEMVASLVARVDRDGPGPILQALVRSDTAEEIRAAAQARLARRLVEPLADGMEGRGADRARLRAEVTVSALIGVALGRSLGWFAEMASVPQEELAALFIDALGTMTGEQPARQVDPVPRAGGAGS